MQFSYTMNWFVFVVDGYMSEWGSWSACSATCGGGYQMRTRTCHDPLFGGKNCTGEVVDLNPSCNSQSCPSQSEILLYWIFFLLRLFRPKNDSYCSTFNVVFIFFEIFASQESDSFMTRRYVFFIFLSYKYVWHIQYSYIGRPIFVGIMISRR